MNDGLPGPRRLSVLLWTCHPSIILDCGFLGRCISWTRDFLRKLYLHWRSDIGFSSLALWTPDLAVNEVSAAASWASLARSPLFFWGKKCHFFFFGRKRHHQRMKTSCQLSWRISFCDFTFSHRLFRINYFFFTCSTDSWLCSDLGHARLGCFEQLLTFRHRLPQAASQLSGCSSCMNYRTYLWLKF